VKNVSNEPLLRRAARNIAEIEELSSSGTEIGEIEMRFVHSYKLFKALAIEKRSQLAQDVFAYSMIGNNGVLLEIGGGDGFHLSNSLNLWKKFGWRGYICEPLPRFASAIRAMKKANKSLELFEVAVGEFCGVVSIVDAGEISSTTEHLRSDSWSVQRIEAFSKNGSINVSCVCPTKLLQEINERIDYLSIDVEGAELDILRAWPWDLSMPKVITVENSNDKEKDKALDDLLTSHGYVRTLSSISLWDGWYILMNRQAEVLPSNTKKAVSCRH
jgi:FkbM family methyltransferase